MRRLQCAACLVSLALSSVGVAQNPQPDDQALASPDANAETVAQEWQVLRVTPPPITNSVVVNASIDDAWALWTDAARMPEFMGFEAEIEPRSGGLYRVVFVQKAASPLARGNNGRILAIEPKRMISFSWMTPMHMKALSGNSTVVTLYFTPIDKGQRTRVDLVNVGYGQGKDWRAAYSYNVRGWDRVLAHFQYALEVGPIDWVARAAELKRNGTLPMWREYQRRALKGQEPADTENEQ